MSDVPKLPKLGMTTEVKLQLAIDQRDEALAQVEELKQALRAIRGVVTNTLHKVEGEEGQ